MSQTALQILVPVGGVCVLSSYAWGLTRPDVSRTQLWGTLQGRLQNFWTLCAFGTVLSYLFLWWLWAFDTPLQDTYESIALLVCQSLFLFSASLWMWFTIQYLRGQSPRWYITLCLWTTALSSIGLMILSHHVSFQKDIPRWKTQVALASGTFLMIQHVFWDALVWNEGFTRSQKDPVVAKKSRFK